VLDVLVAEPRLQRPTINCPFKSLSNAGHSNLASSMTQQEVEFGVGPMPSYDAAESVNPAIFFRAL
jgi:hypothetical protein